MKRELKIFFTAFTFYTRIPSPYKFDYKKEYMLQSTRYLPLIGWVVGGMSAGIFIGSRYMFSLDISIVLSMLLSILITGAFHEDGLADTSDAFGGGWNKEKILSIMKDSQIGSYGVVALILALLLKFVVLTEVLLVEKLEVITVFAIFMSAHSVSRFIALTTMINSQYVRESDEKSKSRVVVQKESGWLSPLILVSAFFGLAPLLLFQTSLIFLSVIPLILVRFFMSQFFKKWIGGYTGDCLGAIQQVCEVVFYLSILVLWKFI